MAVQRVEIPSVPPLLIRISPAGTDLETGDEIMSPEAVRMALLTVSRDRIRPLTLTPDEIMEFEEMAAEIRRIKNSLNNPGTF